MLKEISKIILPYYKDREVFGKGFPSFVEFTIYSDDKNIYQVDREVFYEENNKIVKSTKNTFLTDLGTEGFKVFLIKILDFISTKFLNFKTPQTSNESEIIFSLASIKPLEGLSSIHLEIEINEDGIYNVFKVTAGEDGQVSRLLVQPNLTSESYANYLSHLAFSYSYYIVKSYPELIKRLLGLVPIKEKI